MINPVIIPDALSLRECADILERLKEVRWYDGTESAGALARQVKQNLQARDEDTEALRQMVVRKLNAHPTFNAIARPRFIALMVSRYQMGDFYGPHVDAATVGQHHTAIRRDISFTIALTDVSQYQGGDLVISSAFDAKEYRLGSGQMIVYPSTHLHEVTPVTDGERIVIVGWVRSHIRDAAKRELLYELDAARSQLKAAVGKNNAIDSLALVSANLQRMWMED